MKPTTLVWAVGLACIVLSFLMISNHTTNDGCRFIEFVIYLLIAWSWGLVVAPLTKKLFPEIEE